MGTGKGRASRRSFIRPKKIEALGQLAATVEHDFYNASDGERRQSRVAEEPKQRNGLSEIAGNAMRTVRRGTTLNEQLLGFARKHTPLSEAVDLGPLLTRMNDLLRTSVGNAIRLETRMEREAWPALVDPNQIELVILNLAINAQWCLSTILSADGIQPGDDLVRQLELGRFEVLAQVVDRGGARDQENVGRAVE